MGFVSLYQLKKERKKRLDSCLEVSPNIVFRQNATRSRHRIYPFKKIVLNKFPGKTIKIISEEIIIAYVQL
jgi:hypothetical protein